MVTFLVCAGCVTPGAFAEDTALNATKPPLLLAQTNLNVPLKVNPKTARAIALASRKMTKFSPQDNGFRFYNQFLNVTGVFDITTAGLCGGMVYSALDYFLTGVPAPKQNYLPVSGTTLESYIYKRHMSSLEAHMDKWVELHANPGGARNSEFFNWGLQGSGGGRLQELRAKIDAGQPVPLGLKSLSANPGEDHVVLAVGYDMGRYKGDLGQHKEDLKIFLYEPNFGTTMVTMFPKPDRQQYCYMEKNSRGQEVCWRTYFVQQNYHRTNPPRIPNRPVEMVIGFHTGGDDLRGGNDNVSVSIALADGRRINANNVNKGKRWIDKSWNTIGVSLPDNVGAGGVREITLTTSFSGGMGGDNWNLDEVVASLRTGGSEVQSCRRNGSPLVRFTGDKKQYVLRFPC